MFIKLRSPLLGLVLLYAVTLSSTRLLVDRDCASARESIVDAATEAVDIATYASLRFNAVPSPRPGTLLRDMLGARDEDDVTTANVAIKWFKAVRDMVRSTEHNITIHCNADFLQFVDASTGLFADTTNFADGTNTPFRVSQGSNWGGQSTACPPGAYGFEYDVNSFIHVIVLCPRPSGTPITLLAPWRTKGNIKDADDTMSDAESTMNIDWLRSFYSQSVLHELMHAASHEQFPGLLGLTNELYGFSDITGRSVGQKEMATGTSGPSPGVRQHNADSMALLGCAWFLRQYRWVNGIPFVNEAKDIPALDLENDPMGGAA